MPRKEILLEDDPLWYKDAIIYEVHVRAFYDGNRDGIGDFKGLTQKLDYIQGLGITAIWLLPFYPSPLRDDGYDIADYLEVHRDYGTLKDVKMFLDEAHSRGIRVITELVLNHTSSEHAWFQRARRAKPDSVWRNYYVWSDTPEKYKDARIIFKDFESSNWAWDPIAKAYYWHRFYSHQPDLNYDDPHVEKAMLKAMDYWLNLGVDGLRLDAVPYLYEREGTNCENLPETYEFLKKLRAHIDGQFKNKMLLAEANQWPEDAVAYFGHGDMCNMAFHFPLMPRMFMATRVEDRYPIIDILEQTPSIAETAQWALFLRNHDELTLEMVTDEERDYMYRIYARDPKARINLGIRRRLAPLLENDRRKIELMNGLLFSLPGTPVVYYGDEIGMGDNYYLGDRNGVRTPMQWSGDRNAGFSDANPQKLYLPVIIDPEYHYEAVNVENQDRNRASLLWWMRNFIAMRKHFKAFGRGSIEFMFPENPKVLAFVRQYEDENILVVTNLSRHSQVVELDLSKFSGSVPEEIFSTNKFPVVRNAPYMLTLGPYGYYWFLLQREKEPITVSGRAAIPELVVAGERSRRDALTWEAILEGKTKDKLEADVLPSYIKECRWFGGKARQIQELQIIESIPIRRETSLTHILLLGVQYNEGTAENYLLPVSFASGDKAAKIINELPHAVIVRIAAGDLNGIVYDGVYDEEFCKNLLWLVGRRNRIKGSQGDLIAYPGKALKELAREKELPLECQVIRGEQSNTSISYRNELLLKLYRRLEEGINPDLEVERFLTERAPFPHIPPFGGALEYKRNGEPIVLGILQRFVPNQGDAWGYTVDAVGRFLERVLSKQNEIQQVPTAPSSHLEIAYQEIPPLLQELIAGVYLEMSRLLGRRTAELHLAFASDTEDPNFAPEPFSVLYQRSLYQSMQSRAKRVLQLLDKSRRTLPDNVKNSAEEVLSFMKRILDGFKSILQRKISAMKIRVHGDYHLKQVLYTGKDFIITDFEGEPARPLSERRLKKSPVTDVAGMIRSFHYAAYTGLLRHAPIRPEDVPLLEPWVDLWYRYIGGAFLRSYLQTTGGAPFVPQNNEEFDILLRNFLMERAMYELAYELNNRPDWVGIPLKGIKHLVEMASWR